MKLFSLEPVFTLPQVLAVAAFAIFAVARLYNSGGVLKRGMVALIGLRTAGIIAISILLLNPVRTRSDRDTQKPPLLVLLDASHSMSIPDVEGRSRFDAAKSATIQDTELMRRLQEQYRLRLYSVSDTATPQDLEAFAHKAAPDGERTHLGESIEAALANVSEAPSGGVLLISDGRNNGDLSPIQAAGLAKSRRFPIFTLCLGDTRQAPDVAIVNHRPLIYAVPEQRLSLSADVQSTGYSGQTAVVDLLREGKQIQSMNAVLDDKRAVTVSFPVQEKSEGAYHYTLSVRPMPKEQIVSNNRSAVFVQVLRSRTRVLVLEGRPTWDAKFLLKALRSDPSMEVDSIFKVTAEKYFAMRGAVGGPAQTALHVPKSAADFARYDVIVIGKGYEDLFEKDSADQLKSYVSDHAGNVVFLRGKAEERADALKALEPVQWSSDEIEDVRMKVTDEGQRNPAFNFAGVQDSQLVIQKLPSMISATRVQGEKSLSVVLARASGVESGAGKEMAVVAYQNYGQGKVLSLVGEGLWRWALLPPELKDYTDCYFDFWTQLIRWMVNQSDFLPGQDLSLKTDHSNYSTGDVVHIMAFTRGRTSATLPPVSMTGPDGKTTQVTLAGGGSADFTGVFTPGVPGEYVASLVRPHVGAVVAPFSVYPDREEDRITAADPELMKQVARAAGGDSLTLDQLRQLPEKLRDARATLSDVNLARSAWDRGWVLAVILGLFTLEWVLRRRLGLL